MTKKNISQLEDQQERTERVSDQAASPLDKNADEATAACAVQEVLERQEPQSIETMTPEQRRDYLSDLLYNTPFSEAVDEMGSIFLKVMEQVDWGDDQEEMTSHGRWGLSTEDARRCFFDTVRTEKFQQALKETIRSQDVVTQANIGPGDTVVEAGAGTGILAMMAVACGAKKVYAIEINRKTVKACNAFVEYCGFADTVEILEGDATTMQLPEQVDVIISENMYTGLFVEPQMQVVNNLRKYLKRGGRIIPQTFRSFIELATVSDMNTRSAARNEMSGEVGIASSRAQFDVVVFEQDTELTRQAVVILRADKSITINAVNISSIIELTPGVIIESNDCDFLGQDEIIQLQQPVDLRAGEEYEVSINFEAGARIEDIRIDIRSAKKLRLDKAITAQEREKEKINRATIESHISSLTADMQSFDPEKTLLISQQLAAVATLIHESRIGGLFELYELAQYNDRLSELHAQFLEVHDSFPEQAEMVLREYDKVMESENTYREIEKIFYDTIKTIRALYPENGQIDVKQIQIRSSECASKLQKCAEVLFNFEIGGIFRLDEFYSYVQKLQVYHAALDKIFTGQGILKPKAYVGIMANLEKQLRDHAANLKGVPELLAGESDVMSFQEYNELAMKMTKLYKVYLEKRKNNRETAVNRKPEKKDLHKPIDTEFASTQGGQRYMIEFRGKKGCEYARCANCCFFFEGSTDEEVTAQHIEKQFEYALKHDQLGVQEGEPLKWANPDVNDLYKIDILTPGSFLNDAEMPPVARTIIFEKISKLPFTTVMIEARLEFINVEEIKRLQSILRPDQKIQIAIGLESSNDLVREIAISKGYTWDDFSQKVEVLAGLGVDVQAYSIIKPALLSEAVAIKDSVQTGRDLAVLAESVRNKTGNQDFELTLKLEQAFIQEGGFLDFLHQEGEYDVPWTFSTAEIVRLLCAEGIHEKLNIQVGSSNDYPPPSGVAHNRKLDGSSCNDSTLRLNQALQKFNVDHDVEQFELEVASIAESFPDSYETWLKAKAA
ncbi:MAG: methyltransferase domain-containing protein [Patescibacteria group bacterium]